MHSTLLLTFGVLLLLTTLANQCQGNESPGFFLKITKNVPRLGRRSDSYYLKNMKAIPRIGRRADGVLDVTFPLSKRMLLNPADAAAAAEREYSLVQPVTSNTLIELLNKNAIAADNIKFVHWKDFDRALQTDTELYGKLISLGRKPDQRLKDDLNIDMTSGFTPLLSNNNDYIYYNKDVDEMYAPKYGGDFMRYNQLF
uniref:ATP-dependent helicase/nuclease subunit A n=1 Tax=Zeugodacus cucurbitae TaxID=28588 RepID=A0A0A1XQD1_ZEUCU